MKARGPLLRNQASGHLTKISERGSGKSVPTYSKPTLNPISPEPPDSKHPQALYP